MSVDAVAGVSPDIRRGRLRAHIGEQVHGGLLHGRIGVAAVTPVVQAPRPLHGPGAEHQGAARGTVQGQVVGGGAVELGRAAVVGEVLRASAGRRRHVHQPGGPEPVVGVDVPFIAEGAGSLIQRGGLAGGQAGHPGVAPEPELAVLRWHGDVGGAGVDDEQLPGQRVLRVAAVSRRAEPRIHPGTRPGGRVLRVGGGVVMRLLVGHQRPVRGVRAVDARLQPGLPEDLVPAEEGQVHPRVAGGRDVRALLAGPVLVVAGGHEDLVLLDDGAAPGWDMSTPLV